jgi:hypothetical protein
MGTAAILFVLAALGGLTLAATRLQGAPRPPTWLAVGHGIIGVAGIAMLVIAGSQVALPSLAQISLWVFVLAALGGATMFVAFHLRNRALPIPLVIGHGLIAVAGLVLLLVDLYRG